MQKISNMHRLLHYGALLLCAAAGILLDQWSKHLATVHLKGHEPMIVWDKLLQLTYLENRGAAWGIGQGKQMFFLILGIVVLAVIAYLYVKIPYHKRYIPMRILAVLFVCGAAGNMIDRALRGYVVDFFEFRFISFPVFNVADIYVVCAAIGIVIFGCFFYKDEDFEIFRLRSSDKEHEAHP